jgi:hypothetical protein
VSISRFLVANLLDTSIYRQHVLSAEEEATGREVARLADGRRAARDRWEPTTANSETWFGVTCNRVRAADMLVIDRENNLTGATVSVRVSSDGFATYSTAWSGVLPTVTSYGQTLDSPVRTGEGAYLVAFPMMAGLSWRVYVAAMGAGILPRIAGAWLGQSWTAEIGPLLAGFDDESGSLSMPSIATPALWRGVGRIARQRSARLSYRVRDEYEWAELRYHVDLYHRGHTMWVVPESSQAERAYLAQHPGGAYSVPFEGNRTGRELVTDLTEHQPRARRPR